MEHVSDGWKALHKRILLNESFVELSFDITDPDAIYDATATDNGGSFFSQTYQIVSGLDKDIKAFRTFEQNIWTLDGSTTGLPDINYGDTGFVGNAFSDWDGTFAMIPTITIQFSRVHMNDLPGLTIGWGEAYDEYPTRFLIHIYGESGLMIEKSVESNNEARSVLLFGIDNYNMIRIYIFRWCLPNRRARIGEIMLGVNRIYTKDDIFSYSHSQTCDYTSLELPKAEIRFSINNLNQEFNPNDPNGLSRALMERQRIQVRYGLKHDDKSIEWIPAGVFYLSEWDAPQNGLQANFTARDILGFLSQIYIEGKYSPTGTSLYDLADDVMQKANLPLNGDGTLKWSIDPSLRSITTQAPLPVCTRAECLQIIANAANCILLIDRKGNIQIVPAQQDETDYDISLFNSFSKTETSLTKPLRQIDVAVYQLFADAVNSELFKGVVVVEGTRDVELMYSGPAVNVSAVVTNGTLVNQAYFTNACRLKISGSGNVQIVLTGTTLNASESIVSIINTDTENGETIMISNELITSEQRAKTVGTWINTFLRNRMILSSEWRPDTRLDVMDFVLNENAYGENKVRMTDIELSFKGAFNARGEGRAINGMG